MHRQICGMLFSLLLPITATHSQQKDSMAAAHRHTPGMHGPADSALNARGARAMRVNQDSAVHRFDALGDGGRITLRSTGHNPAAVDSIRRHFTEIERAFRAGDFSTPAFVHDSVVPGTAVMSAARARIRYDRRDIPRGAELRLRTRDPDAICAIHAFMAYQRREHRSPGSAHPLRACKVRSR